MWKYLRLERDDKKSVINNKKVRKKILISDSIEMTNFWLNPSDYGHPFGLKAG